MGVQRRQKLPQGQIHRFFWAAQRAVRQPTGIPRPHQWLLVGVQACRLPAPKPLKPSERSKPLKRLKPVAFSGRPSVPFARHSQPTGIPRPHQWLLMGVQACRLPAPKPLKPSERSKPFKPLKPLKLSKLCQSVSGQIHCFFWAAQRAVRQAFAANRHPKATSMASYGRPSLPFASP